MRRSPISLFPLCVVFDLLVSGLVYLLLLAVGIVVDFWLVVAVLLIAASLGVVTFFLIELQRKGGAS